MSEKTEFRKKALEKRAQLNEDDRRRMSSLITEKLLKLDEFINCKGIYLYMSYGSEVNTEDLAGICLKKGIRVAFPVCVSDNEMEFKEVRSLSELKPGFKGIMEPDKNKSSADFFPDIMIVPGAAFDRNLYRMGYGRGYYDRFILKMPGHIVTAGLAFSAQVYDKIPTDQYDRRLRLVVTEKEILR